CSTSPVSKSRGQIRRPSFRDASSARSRGGAARGPPLRHLLISREYPPARGGGIGTYVLHIARLLAEHGDDVHVIGPRWEGADREREEHCNGKLVVHRVPLRKWKVRGLEPHPEIRSPVLKGLFESEFYPQCFGWQASLLAEKIVAEEGIDVIE